MDKNTSEESDEGYLPALRDRFLIARDRLKGRNDAEKVRYAIKQLRNKLMGNWFMRFLRAERKKSIDDIAEALEELGVASSAEEVKEEISILEKGAAFYDKYRYIVIKRLNDGMYKIANRIGNRADVEILAKMY